GLPLHTVLSPIGRNSQGAHGFTYNVDGPSYDDDAATGGDLVRSLQCRNHVGRKFDFRLRATCCVANLLRCSRARILSLRSNNLFGQGKKYFAHFGNGFVAHGTENKNQAPVFVTGRKRGAKGPSSGGIVRHVENVFGSGAGRGNHLEAARPTGLANSPLDGVGG